MSIKTTDNVSLCEFTFIFGLVKIGSHVVNIWICFISLKAEHKYIFVDSNIFLN